jgi:hypothetical protein
MASGGTEQLDLREVLGQRPEVVLGAFLEGRPPWNKEWLLTVGGKHIRRDHIETIEISEGSRGQGQEMLDEFYKGRCGQPPET